MAEPMASSAAAMDGSLRISPCNLCPRLCGARRDAGERGACGADARIFAARAALHFWEEPVISGERGSGTVFFSRCPLGCVYCQNADIAAADAGVEVTVERLAEVFVGLQDQGALNVNCVTPTHHSLAIAEAVRRARAHGLAVPIVWNTSGYERREAIRMLEGTVDVYLADYKYADGALAQRYSRARDYPEVALAAIGEMLSCTASPAYDEVDGMLRMTRGVIVRHMVLPGAAEASMRALDALHSEFGGDVLYSIMNQYTPVLESRAASGSERARSALDRFPELGQRVGDEEYERVLDYADRLGIDDYFWQQGPAAQESFIPAWNGEGL